jgi:hypothetical protein
LLFSWLPDVSCFAGKPGKQQNNLNQDARKTAKQLKSGSQENSKTI